MEKTLTADILASYIPDISLPQLNEVVQTAAGFLNRVKAPKGFSPTFHLAKALAAGSASTALATLKQIRAGQHTLLPSFVAALNGIVSAFHSLSVFSDKHDAVGVAGELSSQLREVLSVLDTAQAELGKKVELLTFAEGKAERATEIAASLELKAAACAELHNDILDSQTKAAELVAEIRDDLAKSESSRSLFKTAADDFSALLASLAAEREKITELNDESTKQAAVIAGLLPKGASAGLASSFAIRRQQLEFTKWLWLGIFILSIGLLMWTSGNVLSVLKDTSVGALGFWKELLHRLPLIAPAVWLGWFSAVQYGNTIRVQEDYAFKEATAMAFVGYRDHMQHLAEIDSDDGENAMKLLAAKTIEVLSREPLRIYRKSHRDVSPAQEVVALLEAHRRAKGQTKGPEDDNEK